MEFVHYIEDAYAGVEKILVPYIFIFGGISGVMGNNFICVTSEVLAHNPAHKS